MSVFTYAETGNLKGLKSLPIEQIKQNIEKIILLASLRPHINIIIYAISIDNKIAHQSEYILEDLCRIGNLTIIKYLVDNTDITIKDFAKNSFTLELLSRNNHLHVLKYLTTIGLTLQDILNSNAIDEATAEGYIKILKYYVSLGATINNITTKTVHLAIITDHSHVIEYFISLGMTLEYLRQDNCKFLKLAVENGCVHMVKYLLTKCFTFEDICKCKYEIEIAVEDDELKMIKYILSLDTEKKLYTFIKKIAMENERSKIFNYINSLQ